MNEKTNETSQSQRILNAAFKCISSKGYANVSLRDIADEAGVVLSQLNYYYRNKDGLLIEVIKMLGRQYLYEIEENLKKGESTDEKLTYFIKYFEEMLRKNPELFKLLFDLTSMALWSESLKELLNNLFNDVTGLIERYILCSLSDEEKFKGYSSVALSRMILGTMFGTSIQVMLAKDQEDMIRSLSTIQLLFK
ncbi:TetR/AcrR family transcriptional regulator [Desulfosporosinus fructosivorans]